MFSGKNVKIPMINYKLKWIVPVPTTTPLAAELRFIRDHNHNN